MTSASSTPIEQAWRALGASGAPELALHGESGLLGSPYALDDVAIAAVGCTLLAAAELAEARCGRRPTLCLDRAHAAVVFASERIPLYGGDPPRWQSV